MICVCFVDDKNNREDDREVGKDVYFGDQHISGREGGLNVEKLTTVRNNITTGGCRLEKKNIYVLKKQNEISL